MSLPNRFGGLKIHAAETTITSDDITVSATIGETTTMTIFGYAPSRSTVSLFARGIYEERLAETNGYFIIGNILTTDGTGEYPELCLMANIGKYSTQPTCIPSLPGGNHIYNIGPIILSPIISIEQNLFTLGTQVTLNGITIPNSLVKIYLAETESGISLIPSVLAYYIPTYEVTSDSYGKFQFNLPAGNSAKWKVYASTVYGSSASPISNKLNFTVQNKISYFATKVSETVVRTINIITTVVKTAGKSEPSSQNQYPDGVTAYEVETFRRKTPYFVIFIEALILILLIVFVLVKKAKKKKNQNSNQK